MFARTLIYKEYLILISLHDSLFYSLTFQIHIHIHIFISEVTRYFCNFCYRLTILLLFLLKLRPDVAPTAWRRNLCRVPTLPSLHRHAFSSPSSRFLIPLVSLFHPPRHAFSSSSYRFFILLASLFYLTILLLFPLPCGGLLKISPCVRQQFKM